MSVSDVPQNKPSSLGAMWRDKKTRAIIMQIVAVIAILLFFGWLVNNTVSNIENLGIKVGFDFLGNAASYDINQTLVDYTPNDTHLWAGFVGLLNTLLVAVCGVVLATILGFSAGVARLSNNFVLSRLMQVYVEAVRNVPVLLQILLWYGIILHSFPKVKVATSLIEGVDASTVVGSFDLVWAAIIVGVLSTIFLRKPIQSILKKNNLNISTGIVGIILVVLIPILGYLVSGLPDIGMFRILEVFPFLENIIPTNRGVFLPQPLPQDGFGWVWFAFAVGIIGAIFFKGYAKKILDSTGKQLPVLWASLGLIIGLPVIVYFLVGSPLGVSMPELKGFNYKGGFAIKPEFLALWLALSIYTGAFIAEIVRAGILSVSHGQSEAAHALGIKPSLTMRLVVIPQALRVIIPPLISQYLNLTKNSSLAIAIGYMDIVATLGGISLNQSGRALEIMLIILSVYLFISLSISFVMNIYNERVKLVER